MTPGTIIAGRYQVLAEIGRGGMGVVLRAMDHRLQTEVAIKVLRQGLESSDKDSLVKEARVLARLTHPSIVRLFDLADTEEGLLLILEYVRGPNLAQVLERRHKLSEAELLPVMNQICAGLTAAHAGGVIHRDLKPPNLLVALGSHAIADAGFFTTARIKITDFGISKLLATRVSADTNAPFGTGVSISAAGTPFYMAPEQFRGETCTPATDIYALGIIAYQALSGKPPFMADSLAAIAFQHFQSAPKPLEGFSPAINGAILRALAKQPRDRFQTAADFLRAIELAAPKFDPLPTLEPDALDKAVAWIAARKWKLTLAALGLAAIPFTALLVTSSWKQTGPRGRTIRQAAGSDVSGRRIPHDFGKIFKLPADLDVIPDAGAIPLPSPARGQPRAREGDPLMLWTAWIDTRYHAQPRVPATSPDGSVYIADVASKDFWAAGEDGFRWGYRSNEPLVSARYAEPAWNHDMRVDLSDTGRVWASPLAVFNLAGAGGRLSRAGRVFPPEIQSGSSSFTEADPQKSQWPNAGGRYQCSSRQGAVKLTDTLNHWTAEISGKCDTAAPDPAGGIILNARGNTMYSFDPSGRIRWTWLKNAKSGVFKPMPSGDWLVSADNGNTLIAIHNGSVRWSYKSPESIQEFTIDRDGSVYLVSSGSVSTLHALSPSGVEAWRMPFTAYMGLSGGIVCDGAGRLYLAFDHYTVGGEGRYGVFCVALGRLLP